MAYSLAPKEAIDAAVVAIAPHLHSPEDAGQANLLAEKALEAGLKKIAVITARKRKLGPTKRQKECLDLVKKYIKKHGMSPTFSELGKSMGISKVGVHALIYRLCDRGCIRITPHKDRSIIVL